MSFKDALRKQLNKDFGINAKEITGVELDPAHGMARVFYKDEAGEVNVMAIGMAALMFVIVISLYIIFKVIFPATAGTVILSMNVTSTNPMYTTVQSAGTTANGLYGMGDAVMYVGAAAILAAIGLSIFYARSRA